METNNDFFHGSLETWLLAIAIGALTVFAVEAEGNLNLNTLDGLFTPTQSSRFFQAGREDFEREIDFFNHPERYLTDDSIYIDPELIEQMAIPREKLDFSREDVQFKLLLDAEK